MESLVSQLASISKSSFPNDKARITVLVAAQKVVRRLELPFEKAARMTMLEPHLMTGFKIALEMKLFTAIGDERKTCQEIAVTTGADQLLVKRIARLMAVAQILDEVDVDTYTNTDFSKSMTDPTGLCNAFQYHYDLGIPQMAKLPSYLRETGYKNPDDYDNPPFEYIMRPDKGCDNFWHWLDAHPEANAAFNHFMAALHPQDRPAWLSGRLMDRLLSDYDPDRPFVVDIGGGNGTDQLRVLAQLPEQHRNARLIVQDLPAVIDAAKRAELPPQIQLVAHDFFQPQPEDAKAARIFYMSFVLHDWPDNKAIQILFNVRAAMTPGYSRLILHESVVAERDADCRPGLPGSDINMMSHFAALERTKKQWTELFKKAGLKLIDYHERYMGAGLLEVDLL